MTEAGGHEMVVKIATYTFDGLQWTGPKVEFMLGQEVQKSISESVPNKYFTFQN